MSEVTEKQRPLSEANAKTLNAGLLSNIGLPSVVPPSIALAAVKEAPAISTATTEQDSDVFFSHPLLYSISSSCFSMKISAAVLRFLLLVK